MSACVYFTGYIDKNGYGWQGTGRRSEQKAAHRVAYEAAFGPIPPGDEVDHTCHNVDETCPADSSCMHRRCINEEHLEAVSHRENSLRSSSFAAVNARKTECDNGHAFDEANTYVRPGGHRDCRACIRDRARRYRLRQRKAA